MEKLYVRCGIEAMIVSEDANNIVGETSNRANTCSGDETIQTRENRKRKEREDSLSEPLNDGEDESNVPKKKRFIWTGEMHQKFVDAIAQLGEDRAFPKKIVEVMNEPGLTREIVASHLQKYRICLRKSQEERDNTPWMCNFSPGNCQQNYLGTSQVASNNYFPLSTSIHSSLHGIRRGIGGTSVRLAPPSYSAFDVSSLPALNTGNWHTQYSRGTEANKSLQDYGHEERNMLNTFNKAPRSSTSDAHATSSSTSNSAFMGLQIADDGKSLSFGGLDRIVSTGHHSTKRNDLNYQKSEAPLFSCYAQASPLPLLPDYEDHMEESSLQEFEIKNYLQGLESEGNESINLIPQQETYYGTNGNVDINSFFSGDMGTSFDYQNSLQSLASEILENIEREQNAQIFANHTVTSLPPTTSSWNPNTNMASNLLIEEDSLPPLPSEVPWDLYPDTTTSSSVLQFTDQNISPLPPLPETELNVNLETSTMPGSNNNIRDHENLHENLNSDPVHEMYTGNFFDEQNALSDQITEAAFRNPSWFHANMQ